MKARPKHADSVHAQYLRQSFGMAILFLTTLVITALAFIK